MRKLIPLFLAGLAAVSFSALAADDSVHADKRTRQDSSAATGADAKGDANPGAATASDNAMSEKRDDVEGTAKDSHQANPKPGKQAKRKKDQSGAGATGTERRY
jgi:hypothetical protein